MDRFKEPDNVTTFDHEEETYYCQHCEKQYWVDEMQDVEYEICNECFEKAVNHYSKWPKQKLAMLIIMKKLVDTVPGTSENMKVFMYLSQLHEYMKGVE